MAISFSHRSSDIEIMDDLSYHDEVIFQTLRELDFINQWLGGNAVTLHALKKVLSQCPQGKSLTVADLGCGSGEMLRLIKKYASSVNRELHLTGIDANEHIVHYAADHSRDYSNLNFEAINIFSDEFARKQFDIVMATLFLHHFSDKELQSLFSSLKKQTRVAIIVNDIHRHPLAYYSIKWLTQLFSKSSMVKFDAPLSVLRAFTRKELLTILEKSGIKKFELKWKWAFRWQLIIYCQSN
ncbi:MAG: methyltransferase domain-containing protein [Bacteroidetes bacterium]|nr:methyltransferase domain-containing protein [Bacteroidota bacterium]